MVTKLVKMNDTVSPPNSCPVIQSFWLLFWASLKVARSRDFNCTRPVMVKGARLRTITQMSPAPPTPGGGLLSR